VKKSGVIMDGTACNPAYYSIFANILSNNSSSSKVVFQFDTKIDAYSQAIFGEVSSEIVKSIKSVNSAPVGQIRVPPTISGIPNIPSTVSGAARQPGAISAPALGSQNRTADIKSVDMTELMAELNKSGTAPVFKNITVDSTRAQVSFDATALGSNQTSDALLEVNSRWTRDFTESTWKRVLGSLSATVQPPNPK